MTLPREILESAERVWQYHRLSKLTEATPVTPADLNTRLSIDRIFDFAPKVELSRKLLDLPTSTMAILEQGSDALPESMRAPPQDLRTLSTWLYMAAGQRAAHRFSWGSLPLRAAPSADSACPSEIYVAAFAIEGLQPGLYHFSARDFALRKLRDAPETLALLRRGRPDLQFLGTVPAALLISSVFARACWRQGPRGYRQALIDVGHVVANCHLAAAGLGMDSHTRLRMIDHNTRELIGLSEDFDFAAAESVQAMVVWADRALNPMPAIAGGAIGALPPIPRPVDANAYAEVFQSVIGVHREMIARGVATREVRSPLTELTPLPLSFPLHSITLTSEETPSKPLRAVLTDVKHVDAFEKQPLPRELFHRIARSAFRGGTYYPIRPEGPHVGLVRAFWIVLEVPAVDSGIYWHDPAADKWGLLNRGNYKFECIDLARGRPIMEYASAVCVMVANLQRLLLEAGPDVYRLALLEAGVVAQRMNLAANSFGFSCQSFGDFHDDAWRQFLGLGATGWEPLLISAIGTARRPTPPANSPTRAMQK